MWPAQWEDSLLYRGVSCWDSEQLAAETGRSVNAALAEKGKNPRWTHIVEIAADGHQGHVVIREGPEGHVTLLAEPKHLLSSAENGLPIPLEAE